jgi:hypothetical protein
MDFLFEDAIVTPAKMRCRLETESEVVAAAAALGALRIPDLSSAERALIRRAGGLPDGAAEHLRREIGRKCDPLGDAFAMLRTPAERRAQGATYTPLAIVEAMVIGQRRFRRNVLSIPA